MFDSGVPSSQRAELVSTFTNEGLVPFESGQLDSVVQLFGELKNAVMSLTPQDVEANPLSIDTFAEVVNTYRQPSRFFHTVEHLLDMTSPPDADYQELSAAFIGNRRPNGLSSQELFELKYINQLAAFFHDEEYVHVDGNLSPVGEKLKTQGFITQDSATYTVAATLPESEEGKTIQMVLDIFGIKAGDTLSPFNGMNELLSAMNAALELQKTGISKEALIGVIASIEATIPFRDENRMNALRDRVDAVIGREITFTEADRSSYIADKLVANATLLANHDVKGLAGGLIEGEAITAQHVAGVMKGTDRLHREEVPRLRVDQPGTYPPAVLLAALNKQHNLFNGMLYEGSNKEIFHGLNIRDSKLHYPPTDQLDTQNLNAHRIAAYMGAIMAARDTAVALVTALAQNHGQGEAHLSDLMSNLNLNDLPASTRTFNDYEKVAHEILANPRDVGMHDTTRSLIADALLQKLGAAKILQLVGDSPFTNSTITPILNKKEGAAQAFIDALKKEAPEIVERVQQSIEAFATGRNQWVTRTTTQPRQEGFTENYLAAAGFAADGATQGR